MSMWQLDNWNYLGTMVQVDSNQEYHKCELYQAKIVKDEEIGEMSGGEAMALI